MPKITINLDDTYEMVYRPAILAITKQMISHAGLDRDNDLSVSFRGDLNVSKDQFATLGLNGEVSDRYGSTEKLSVEVNEEEVVGTIQHSRSVHGEPLIMVDGETNTYAHCVYSTKKVTASFKYRSDSRNEINSIRNNLIQLYANRKEIVPHEIEYEVPIPKFTVALFSEIHKLKVNGGGTNLSVKEFFDQCFQVKHCFLSNQSEKFSEIGYKEIQRNLKGLFDIGEIPKTNHVETGTQYELEFTYSFYYSKPISFYMSYPVAVYSELLPKPFIDTRPQYDYIRIDVGKSEYAKAHDHFMRGGQVWLERREGIVEPDYDDHPMILSPRGYRRLSRDLFLSEPNDNHLFDVRDLLGSYNMSDDFFEMVIENRNNIFNTYSGHHLIMVTGGDTVLNSSVMSMDETGNVYLNRNLDISKSYRVYFFLLTDYTLLPVATKKMMVNRPESTIKAITMIDPSLIERNLIPKIVGKKKLVERQFEVAIMNMETKGEIKWHKFAHWPSNVLEVSILT